MESLKIVIGKSKGVAEQARKLFKELGYYVSKELYANCYGWVVGENCGDYLTSVSLFDKNPARLIDINQLRDLVFLKRNSIDDATHVSQSGSKWFVSSDNKIHSYLDKKWVFISDDASDLQDLKPIEKKEMKEFLEPHPNGKYVFVNAEKPLHPSWIEIPEGAEKATISKENRINFWKENGLEWFSKVEKDWCEYSNMEKHINIHGHEIVWQRHTQPEELPFVDDEHKYNENPLLTQVGGDHYKSLPIQPVEFAMKNNLDYCQANAIKYIIRHANKNGKQDLEKAKHYIDLLIEHYYGDKDE